MSQFSSDTVLYNLLRGTVKSIPFAGSFLEQLIYGYLEGKDRVKESEKLYTVLDTLQGQLKSLEDIVNIIQTKVDFTVSENNRIESLASTISQSSQEKDITIPNDLKEAYSKSLLSSPLNAYVANISDEFVLWRGLRLSTPVSIDEIYVSTTLSEESREGRKNFNIENNLSALLSRSNNLYNLLILGTPGSGKSTFLRHIATQLSRQYNRKQTSKIPIFLHLPDVEIILKNENNWFLPIHEIIVKKSIHFGGEDFKSVLKESLESEIKNGDAIILLDALDEVPEGSLRQIKTWIESMCSSKGNSRVILASRPISLTQGFNSFKELRVEPFNPRKQDLFIKRWFKYHKEEERGNEMINYLNQPIMNTVRGAAELSGTPLFLTMMCIEFMDKKEISKTPAKLIDYYTFVLLEGWDNQNAVQPRPDQKDIEIKRAVLEAIASYCFMDKKNSFEFDSISDLIRNTIEKKGESSNFHYAKRTLEEIVQRSGLLIVNEDGRLKFSNKVFLEFFVARYRYRLKNQAKWLRKISFEERYDNVVWFYTQLMQKSEKK